MRNTCLDMVYELAKRDRRTVFIGSDLSPGLLAGMKREMPERYYMEGVTEANIIGMDNRPRAIRSARVSPSTSSITRNR